MRMTMWSFDCPTIVKQFVAEEISALVLRKLVEDASKFLNDEVSKTVITCLRTSMICEGWQPKMQAALQGYMFCKLLMNELLLSLPKGLRRKTMRPIWFLTLEVVPLMFQVYQLLCYISFRNFMLLVSYKCKCWKISPAAHLYGSSVIKGRVHQIFLASLLLVHFVCLFLLVGTRQMSRAFTYILCFLIH